MHENMATDVSLPNTSGRRYPSAVEAFSTHQTTLSVTAWTIVRQTLFSSRFLHTCNFGWLMLRLHYLRWLICFFLWSLPNISLLYSSFLFFDFLLTQSSIFFREILNGDPVMISEAWAVRLRPCCAAVAAFGRGDFSTTEILFVAVEGVGSQQVLTLVMWSIWQSP